jgi:hypothetical protein
LLGYVFVAVVAGAVGWAVYRLVMRFGPGELTPMTAPGVPGPSSDADEWRGVGDRRDRPDQAQLPVDGSYIPVGTSSPSWHSRLAGLMGLVISVVVAAVTLAFALYSIGHLIARLMSHAAGG